MGGYIAFVAASILGRSISTPLIIVVQAYDIDMAQG